MARKPKRPSPPKKLGTNRWEASCPECRWRKVVDSETAATAWGALLIHGMAKHGWPMDHLEN